jgi:hypothetical protein
MWARAYSAGNSKVQSDHPREFSGKSILKTFNSWNIRAFYEVTPDGSNEFKCLHINHPDQLKGYKSTTLKVWQDSLEHEFLE